MRGRTPVRGRRAGAIAAVLAGSLLLLPSAPMAACHIAAFTETEHAVGEGAGSVTLTVELVGGQPSCEGTVRYETVDDTATAPADYTASSGELRFVAGDDRTESFSIPITDDDADEGDERFRVRLTGGSGDIAPSSTPATVVITDDDEAPAEESPTPAAESPTPATESPTPATAPGADDGGGANAGLIAGIVAGVAVLAAAALLIARRGGRGPSGA